MIHKFSMNGVNVVMDVISGAVHVVDEIIYDIVDSCENMSENEVAEKFAEKYSKEAIHDAYEEINELREGGMLFAADDYTNVLEMVGKRQPVVKALCLHIAHDCNLKCKYCFAEEGEYHGHIL